MSAVLRGLQIKPRALLAFADLTTEEEIEVEGSMQRSSSPSFPVQVIDVEPSSLKIVVSDSHHYITAYLTPESLQQSSAHSSLYEMRGNVVYLKEYFFLTASRCRNADDNVNVPLCLHVSAYQAFYTSKSEIFGDPISITEDGLVKTHLSKLTVAKMEANMIDRQQLPMGHGYIFGNNRQLSLDDCLTGEEKAVLCEEAAISYINDDYAPVQDSQSSPIAHRHTDFLDHESTDTGKNDEKAEDSEEEVEATQTLSQIEHQGGEFQTPNSYSSESLDKAGEQSASIEITESDTITTTERIASSSVNTSRETEDTLSRQQTIETPAGSATGNHASSSHLSSLFSGLVSGAERFVKAISDVISPSKDAESPPPPLPPSQEEEDEEAEDGMKIHLEFASSDDSDTSDDNSGDEEADEQEHMPNEGPEHRQSIDSQDQVKESTRDLSQDVETQGPGEERGAIAAAILSDRYMTQNFDLETQPEYSQFSQQVETQFGVLQTKSNSVAIERATFVEMSVQGRNLDDVPQVETSAEPAPDHIQALSDSDEDDGASDITEFDDRAGLNERSIGVMNGTTVGGSPSNKFVYDAENERPRIAGDSGKRSRAGSDVAEYKGGDERHLCEETRRPKKLRNTLPGDEVLHAAKESGFISPAARRRSLPLTGYSSAKSRTPSSALVSRSSTPGREALREAARSGGTLRDETVFRLFKDLAEVKPISVRPASWI